MAERFNHGSESFGRWDEGKYTSDRTGRDAGMLMPSYIRERERERGQRLAYSTVCLGEGLFYHGGLNE